MTAKKSSEKNVKKDQKLSPLQVIIREVKSILLIAFIVFAFKSTFFGTYVVPTGSMIPNIKIGDFLVVNQFAYGLRLPFTEYLDKQIFLTKQKYPKRGEVIVFKYPRDTGLNYIKRVIGLPGDTIEIIDYEVFVNGEKIEQVKIDGEHLKKDMVDEYKYNPYDFYRAQTGIKEHVLQVDRSGFGIHANHGPITVPQGQYFVMGDNRSYSADSREWGMVPQKYLIGRAIGIWFSMVSPFSEHKFQIRLNRIGNKLN